MDIDNKKYEEYTTEDFLGDPYFIEWVKKEDKSISIFWEDWLNVHPHKKTEVLQAKSIVRSANYKISNGLSDKEELELYEGIIKAKDVTYQIKSATIAFADFYKIAAVLTFLIISGIGFYKLGFTDKPSANIVELEWLSSKTDKGVKTTFTLSDGTHIKLNANSELRYPRRFDDDIRKVFLVGEAFFDVAENQEKPFIIETGGIDTKVLGTSFNIKSNSSHNKVQVTVVTGLVEVKDKNSNSKINLKPFEAVSYNHLQKNMNKYRVNDLEEIIGWKEGKLIFKESSFEEVCTKLENWYGVKIDLPKNFKSPKAYDGAYQNKTLKKVLEGMCYALDLKFKIEGKQVYIRNK